MPYTLTIPSTSLSKSSENSTPYTIYNLTIQEPLRKNVLDKRYSDFVTLDSELSSTTSSSPPVSLPRKSWFTRTISSPALTEQRRVDLEKYVQAIEQSQDSKWRDSTVWRAFLGFPPGTISRRGSTISGDFDNTQSRSMTSSQWRDEYDKLKDQLQEARTQLARRESPDGNVAMQHEASAAAKRSLVKAKTLILKLEQALGSLDIGEGEMIRRKNLVQSAKKERDGLEMLLNTWALSARSNSDSINVSSVSNVRKQDLFSGKNSISTGTSPRNNDNANSFISKGRRVLGGPAKESQRTSDKDNEEVLMLQRQIMKEQDMSADELGSAVKRLKELGVVIKEEVDEQIKLLEVIDEDTDRVLNKINIARKGIRKLNG